MSSGQEAVSADAAATRTPDETNELTRRGLRTTFGVMRDIVADPSVLDEIPDEVTMISIPADDPELAAAEGELGLAALRRGEDVYFRHVRRDTPPERVWQESRELDRNYRRVWERMRAGEIDGDQAVEEAMALLHGASDKAIRLATRRSEIHTDDLTERTGVSPSPAIAAILAYLKETRQAAESGRGMPDADDFGRRMDALTADLKAEIRRDCASDRAGHDRG